MPSPCPHCGHALWSEVRSIRTSRFVVYFDDDERSDTYAEQVRSCPECGADLLGHAMDPQELTSQPMVRRVVDSRRPLSH